MNCDDIIRMARNDYGIYAFTAESLAEFAALVAAAEREECAKIAEDQMEEWEDVRPKLAIKECADAIRARGNQ